MEDEVKYKLVARCNNSQTMIQYVPHPVDAVQRWTGGSELKFYEDSGKRYHYLSNLANEDEDSLAIFTENELEQLDKELLELLKPVRI